MEKLGSGKWKWEIQCWCPANRVCLPQADSRDRDRYEFATRTHLGNRCRLHLANSTPHCHDVETPTYTASR